MSSMLKDISVKKDSLQARLQRLREVLKQEEIPRKQPQPDAITPRPEKAEKSAQPGTSRHDALEKAGIPAIDVSPAGHAIAERSTMDMQNIHAVAQETEQEAPYAPHPQTSTTLNDHVEQVIARLQPHKDENDGAQEQHDSENEGPQPDITQHVRHLLGIVSQPSSSISLQERQLAQDMLAVLLSEHHLSFPPDICAMVVERTCQMQPAPIMLVRAVLSCASAQDKARLGEELHLDEDGLLQLLHEADSDLLTGLLRRRHIPAVVTQEIIQAAPPELLSLLLGNEGAIITEGSWRLLLQHAASNGKIVARMLSRSNLPRHVMLELFWHMTSQQRRLMLLRQAGDSQQLKNLLNLALPGSLRKGGGKEFLVHFHVALGLLAEGDRHGAAMELARYTGLHDITVQRILRDELGEPLGVMFKAAGLGMASLKEVLESMRAHRKAHQWPWLENPEHVQEMHSLLGINAARMMLLYWDWRVRQKGPYRDFAALRG